VRGPQATPDYLTEEDMEEFFTRTWKVDKNSNRTGIRLASHKFKWARKGGGISGGHPSNILDNSYPLGAININGDLPVILAHDGPTAGGFVVAGTIAHVGLWKLGQLRPVGDSVRFQELSVDEAIGRVRALMAAGRAGAPPQQPREGGAPTGGGGQSDPAITSLFDFPTNDPRITGNPINDPNILDFVKQEEIDPRYFETPYYLVPSKGGERPYALLREAMRKSGLAKADKKASRVAAEGVIAKRRDSANVAATSAGSRPTATPTPSTSRESPRRVSAPTSRARTPSRSR
jgi:hypothetical protein